MRNVLLISAFALASAVACSSDKRAGNINEPMGGSGGEADQGGATSQVGGGGDAGAAGANGGDGGTTSGGKGGAANGGNGGTTGGASATVAPGAPVVTFVSPPSVLDPNAVGVVIKDTATVTCKAAAAAEPGSTVDPGSVHITMTQGTDVVALEPLETTMVAGARESVFVLTKTISGIVTFDCNANDRSNPPLYGNATPLDLLVDRGPIVDFARPSPGEAVALTEGVYVDFTVTPNPIADGDQKADTQAVEVLIGGKKVTVNETTPGSGQYAGRVSLTDPKVFPLSEQPNGATAIQVIATNERGTVTSRTQNFTVDGTAPTIAVTSPAPGTIVGSNVQLIFTVRDPAGGAGVNPGTVAVRINSLPAFFYDPLQQARWQHPDADTFLFTLSESDLSAADAQATIQITATDKVGNTNSGQSMSLYLDFVPPIVHLDPPTVRERYFEIEVNKQVCSNAFDPLGEAISDLQIVSNAGYYRSFVWDDTNSAGPFLPRYYAGTDQGKVWLYIQDNLDYPLLVDTDGDPNSYCDDIDPGPDGIRKPPLQLKPVTPAGLAPWVYNTTDAAFNAADDTRFVAAPSITGYCAAQGWLRDPEYFLCESRSDMVHVISHTVGGEPVIYGNAPAAGKAIECTGRYWEIKPLISRPVRDGWVCMAAMAIDKVGNRGVSPPLRVCYDDPSTALVPDCKTAGALPEVPWVSAWSNWIPYGTVDTDPFPDRSAATPPSCAKACTINPKIVTPRFIN